MRPAGMSRVPEEPRRSTKKARIILLTVSLKKTDEKYLSHFASRSERFAAISRQALNNLFCFKSEYNAFTEKNQVHTRSLH